MSQSRDPEDVRLRFGMDPPRLEEQRHWEELAPGADEYLSSTPVHIDVCPECGEATTYHPLDPPMQCKHDPERYVPVRYVPGELADDADGEA